MIESKRKTDKYLRSLDASVFKAIPAHTHSQNVIVSTVPNMLESGKKLLCESFLIIFWLRFSTFSNFYHQKTVKRTIKKYAEMICICILLFRFHLNIQCHSQAQNLFNSVLNKYLPFGECKTDCMFLIVVRKKENRFCSWCKIFVAAAARTHAQNIQMYSILFPSLWLSNVDIRKV